VSKDVAKNHDFLPMPEHVTAVSESHGHARCRKVRPASLRNLDLLPATGAVMIAASLRIVNGAGVPCECSRSLLPEALRSELHFSNSLRLLTDRVTNASGDLADAIAHGDLMYRHGLTAVLLFLLSTPATGQPPRSRDSSTRVVIMASDSALGTTHALVLRRAALNPREVILLDSAAGPLNLAASMRLLTALRAQWGDSLTTDWRVSPGFYAPARDYPGSPYEQWLNDQLKRLAGAKRYSVAGLGSGRVIVITLPAGHGTSFTPPVRALSSSGTYSVESIGSPPREAFTLRLVGEDTSAHETIIVRGQMGRPERGSRRMVPFIESELPTGAITAEYIVRIGTTIEHYAANGGTFTIQSLSDAGVVGTVLFVAMPRCRELETAGGACTPDKDWVRPLPIVIQASFTAAVTGRK
jgi:hypothetical protein